MNSFYWLREPISQPSPPSHWSFSTLQSWRHCPLQWSLLKSKYTHVPEGNYPTSLSPAAFQGQIIHSVLETYSRFVREHKDSQPIQKSFPIRKIVQQRCDELLQQQAKNPRVDVNQLKSKISLNRYINLFKRLRNTHLTLPSHPSSPQEKTYSSTSTKNGAEIWIQADNPPLRGCLDIVYNDNILDLKTGESKPSDKEQLLFYALLYWLKEERLPKSLKIYYTQTSEYVEIEVPSESEIRNLSEKLRHEIETINLALRNKTVRAEPEEKKCKWCPVRHLCNSYWTSHKTELLRATSLSMISCGNHEEAHWCDIHLESLPGSWNLGFPCIGMAYSPGLGEIHVNINQARCPDGSDDAPLSAKVLNAQIKQQENQWHLSVGKFTEAFWISGMSS